MGWFDDNHPMGEAHQTYMAPWPFRGPEGSYSPGAAHRDSETGPNPAGYYHSGTRKCSICQQFKVKEDFNKEEAAKPATKRCCNDCGAPPPSDLTLLTVAQLKAELTQRGMPVAKLLQPAWCGA